MNKGILAILFIAIFCFAFAFFLYIPYWNTQYWDFSTAPENVRTFMQLGFVIVMIFSIAMVIGTFID